MTDGPSGRPDEGGTLRPTSPTVLAVWGLVGLVLGWLFHPLSDRWGTPPVVTWAQPLTLLLVAAILGYTAWSTWRTVHVHAERLAPNQAVNRLVLARACAFVGALAGGGYLGYALSWLGDGRRAGRCASLAIGRRGRRRPPGGRRVAAPRACVSRQFRAL